MAWVYFGRSLNESLNTFKVQEIRMINRTKKILDRYFAVEDVSTLTKVFR